MTYMDIVDMVAPNIKNTVVTLTEVIGIGNLELLVKVPVASAVGVWGVGTIGIGVSVGSVVEVLWVSLGFRLSFSLALVEVPVASAKGVWVRVCYGLFG